MSYRIGIDIGGTNIKAGVMDEAYKLLRTDTIATEADTPFEYVVRNIVDLFYSLIKAANIKTEEVLMLGIGIPSCINSKTGIPVYANNTQWKEKPIKKELEQHIPIPIFICNDADCALIGEKLSGAAKEYDNVLMLTLGTGVGSSLLIDGKVYAGADGMGMEIGHIPFVHKGLPCTCGMDGCYEVYASVTGLIRQTREAVLCSPNSLMATALGNSIEQISGKTAFEFAALGDETAKKVLNQYFEYVAHGIGGMINIFRPELIIIGGAICNEGENLLGPLREKTKKYVFAHDIIGSPPIVSAVLGNTAGIIGAAYLDK